MKRSKVYEEELVRVALYDIEKSLGIKGEPEVIEVTNWKDLMPKISFRT